MASTRFLTAKETKSLSRLINHEFKFMDGILTSAGKYSIEDLKDQALWDLSEHQLTLNPADISNIHNFANTLSLHGYVITRALYHTILLNFVKSNECIKDPYIMPASDFIVKAAHWSEYHDIVVNEVTSRIRAHENRLREYLADARSIFSYETCDGAYHTIYDLCQNDLEADYRRGMLRLKAWDTVMSESDVRMVPFTPTKACPRLLIDVTSKTPGPVGSIDKFRFGDSAPYMLWKKVHNIAATMYEDVDEFTVDDWGVLYAHGYAVSGSIANTTKLLRLDNLTERDAIKPQCAIVARAVDEKLPVIDESRKRQFKEMLDSQPDRQSVYENRRELSYAMCDAEGCFKAVDAAVREKHGKRARTSMTKDGVCVSIPLDI
jgi:hypothetical protein